MPFLPVGGRCRLWGALFVGGPSCRHRDVEKHVPSGAKAQVP